MRAVAGVARAGDLPEIINRYRSAAVAAQGAQIDHAAALRPGEGMADPCIKEAGANDLAGVADRIGIAVGVRTAETAKVNHAGRAAPQRRAGHRWR